MACWRGAPWESILYFDFEIEGFTELDAQILTGIPAGRRALGLLQISETQRAEIELRALASRASRNVLQSLVSLADRVNMPGLSLQIAGSHSRWRPAP